MARDDQNRETPAVDPPRGMHDCQLDDKGRLKLPSTFQQFLTSIAEKKLFVTSLDRRIARIYPISVWRENEKLIEDFRDRPQSARNVMFTAQDLGADAEMDSQGRVLFNTTLRRDLDLENQPLHIYVHGGHFEVLTEGIYQERRQLASKAVADDLELLERAGFK